MKVSFLISPEQIPCVYFILDISKRVHIESICQNDITFVLKLLQIINHKAAEELTTILQRRLKDDDWDTLCLDALHNTLDCGGAEVIAIALHGQPIHAYCLRILCDNLICNEVLTDGITFYNRLNHSLRHILIVSEKLLGILGKTIPAIAERRIVVVPADTRIHTHAIDNHLCIKTLSLGIGVKFIEVTDADSQISIGEQLNRFRLGQMSKKDRYVLRILSNSLLFDSCPL